MSAQILTFPNRNNTVANTCPSGYMTIKGVQVAKPRSGEEYLVLCKQFLDVEDYKDVLCGILDAEHYDGIKTYLQQVVNAYYRFNR